MVKRRTADHILELNLNPVFPCPYGMWASGTTADNQQNREGLAEGRMITVEMGQNLGSWFLCLSVPRLSQSFLGNPSNKYQIFPSKCTCKWSLLSFDPASSIRAVVWQWMQWVMHEREEGQVVLPGVNVASSYWSQWFLLIYTISKYSPDGLDERNIMSLLFYCIALYVMISHLWKLVQDQNGDSYRCRCTKSAKHLRAKPIYFFQRELRGRKIYSWGVWLGAWIHTAVCSFCSRL